MPFADPERAKQYRREWKARHKTRLRDKTLAYKKNYHHRRGKHVVRERRYGIPPETFTAMLRWQNGQCGICHRVFDDTALPPCIDHDHKTGMIRGLLCSMCNRTLGAFDSIEWLTAAIQYLK